MPLLTGMALGRLTPGGLALAAAAVLAFAAHEPFLVALGQRGRRALEEDGARARLHVVRLGASSLVLGGAGLAFSPPAARQAALLPLALAIAVAWLVWRKLEKTVAGELLAAAALSSCGLPVALAGGAPLAAALAAWATWLAAFASATLAVQAVLSRSRSRGGRDRGRPAAAATLLLLSLAALAGAHRLLPWAVALALLPMAALSLALCLLPIEPRRLREAGWGYISASVATMVVLLVGLR
jgi:hypothetical protein